MVQLNPRNATTILGIDPSIRRTGVARWRDGVMSTMTVATDESQPIEARMRWTMAHIWPLITTRTFVVLEAPYVTSNGATSMMLAGLHYVLRYGLYARGVPFGVVRPANLKQWACDSGNADKPAMVQMAAATFGPGAGLLMGAWKPAWPVSDVDMVNDEADALWCMHMGLYHLWQSEWEPADPNARWGEVMEPGVSDAQESVYKKAATEWPTLEWS